MVERNPCSHAQVKMIAVFTDFFYCSLELVQRFTLLEPREEDSKSMLPTIAVSGVCTCCFKSSEEGPFCGALVKKKNPVL